MACRRLSQTYQMEIRSTCGYSRLITFLQVSINNRASTVLNAVDEFGLPSRIRTDKGGENVLIVRYMVGHPERGPDRGSTITGYLI